MLNERIRVDLHIHSNESWHKENKFIVSESDIAHLDVLLNKLEEYRINLISITDHNYLNAPLYHNLVEIIHEGKHPSLQGVIPGVEFDVVMEEGMEGCHVMAYFDVRQPEQYDHISQVLEQSSKRLYSFKYTRSDFERTIYKIGLPTILLAYQRRDPDNSRGKSDNSFSLGVENYLSYLRAGYISGFDLQKPLVEGFILSRLSEVASIGNVASLIASDCHQWSAYPFHDITKVGDIASYRFTEYNALPTFRGLQMALTSPETRFNRSEAPDCKAIDSLAIGSQEVLLSSGINAIIGDNGSGKSTLLHILADKMEKHQRAIAEVNDIAVRSSGERIRLVEQASLANSYAHNTDLEREFDIDYYPMIDGNGFRSSITEYVHAITMRVAREIAAHEEKPEKKLPIEAPQRTFQVSIARSMKNQLDDSEPSSRVTALNEINRMINLEIAEESYTDNQRSLLVQAGKCVAAVLTGKSEELAGVRSTNMAMGVVADQVAEYEKLAEKKRNSADAAAHRLAQRKATVVSGVVARAKAACDRASAFPSFPNMDGARRQAWDGRPRAGYMFITYHPYHDMSDTEIEEALFSALFNKGVSSSADLYSVSSKEKWVDCVKGTKDEGEVTQKLEEK